MECFTPFATSGASGVAEQGTLLQTVPPDLAAESEGNEDFLGVSNASHLYHEREAIRWAWSEFSLEPSLSAISGRRSYDWEYGGRCRT